MGEALTLSLRAQALLVIVNEAPYGKWQWLNRYVGIGPKAIEELVEAGFLEVEPSHYVTTSAKRYRLKLPPLTDFELGDLWIE